MYSPNLFNGVLEALFKKLEWEYKGIKIDGKILKNLRFADDVIIIAKNLIELREITLKFTQRSK